MLLGIDELEVGKDRLTESRPDSSIGARGRQRSGPTWRRWDSRPPPENWRRWPRPGRGRRRRPARTPPDIRSRRYGSANGTSSRAFNSGYLVGVPPGGQVDESELVRVGVRRPMSRRPEPQAARAKSERSDCDHKRGDAFSPSGYGKSINIGSISGQISDHSLLCQDWGLDVRNRPEIWPPGRLLVASPLLVDPNFYKTVVLMLQHDRDGAVGVVLNRPSEEPVESHLPEWVRRLEDPPVIFVGGPVDRAVAIGVVRSDRPSEPTAAQRGRHGGPGRRSGCGHPGSGPGVLRLRRLGPRSGRGRDGRRSLVRTRAHEPMTFSPQSPADLWTAVLRRQGGTFGDAGDVPARPFDELDASKQQTQGSEQSQSARRGCGGENRSRSDGP